MQVRNNFLFNFAVSYSGGGFKRLYEYARWFNENGGAWFIVHARCENLQKEFPNNRFFPVLQQNYRRLFRDCEYLDGIRKETGEPALYYSYGIPIYGRFGKVNWFHLSNVLPLGSRGIPLPAFERLKLNYLGWVIKRNLRNADIISAESNNSLGLIKTTDAEKLFLSVNGSDDELSYLQNGGASAKDNIATVLGTQKYKALLDSYRVFEMLRRRHNELKLAIIGPENTVPKELRGCKDVILKGTLQRAAVIECLRKTRYYISTSRIENSYNAASEGVLFADESYISDIGPHRELLMTVPYEYVSVPQIDNRLIRIKKENVSGIRLKTWNDVICDMTGIALDRLNGGDVAAGYAPHTPNGSWRENRG